MRLLHVTTLRLSLLAAAVLTFWSALFYFALMDEVTDEVDDALEDYAENIILRSLRGEPLPTAWAGSNNEFFQRKVSADYAARTPHIRYADCKMYLPAKGEKEPARVLTYIYRNDKGEFVELTVATPHIDRADLRDAIAGWMMCLYLLLMLSIVGVNLWGVRRTMRPLKRLLEWLEHYRLGADTPPLPHTTKIDEFRRLGECVERTMQRGERIYEEQKMFVAHASHELQTPIAACRARVEMLLEEETLTEEQAVQLVNVSHTLERMARLNRSLLLLCRIENGQLDSDRQTDLYALLPQLLSDLQEVFAGRHITADVCLEGQFRVRADEGLATTLLANLLKNAFVHNVQEGRIVVRGNGNALVLANTGVETALPAGQIFRRFYHTSGSGGGTGLGLALAEAVCKRLDLHIGYTFHEGMHTFTLQRKAADNRP